MTRFLTVVRGALLGCLLLSPDSAVAAQEPILVRGVHLVPLTGERVVENASVLIRDGRIAAIGRDGTLSPAAGVRVIDGGGRYLMPGLVEMHIHLRKRIDLDLLLGHGVTFARNMDGTDQVLAWRGAIAAGELLGPSLTSGSPFLHRSAHDSPERFVGSVEDAIRMTNRYADAGYDYIKIAELDDEPFYALMSAASERGIPVVGHIPNYELDLARILEQGMASIEHLEELFRVYFDYRPEVARIPAFVELVRRSGVPISTLIASEQIKNDLFEQRAGYLTPERLAWVERYNGAAGVERIRGTLEMIDSGGWPRQHVDVDFLLELVRALHEAGVVLVPGTDSGGSFLIAGLGLHEELALFERAGLSPYEALRSATVDAAAVLGLSERLGTVEVGKDADLILLDRNPLEDLGAVREPFGMVLAGRWLDAERLAELRGRTFADEN